MTSLHVCKRKRNPRGAASAIRDESLQGQIRLLHNHRCRIHRQGSWSTWTCRQWDRNSSCVVDCASSVKLLWRIRRRIVAHLERAPLEKQAGLRASAGLICCCGRSKAAINRTAESLVAVNCRILPVVQLQLFVQFRMPFSKLLRLFKEILCDDGEEFSRIRRPILVDQGRTIGVGSF